MANYKVIPQNKGQNLLYYTADDCLYYKNRTGQRDEPDFYRCWENSQQGKECSGSGKVYKDDPNHFVTIRQHSSAHNHISNANAMTSRATIMRRVVENSISKYSIYVDELERMDVKDRPFLKSYKKIRRTLQRFRMQAYPSIGNLDELSKKLEQDRQFKIRFTNINGVNSYRSTVRVGQDIAVIFISPGVQSLAGTVANIAVDGTFRTRPLDSAQVLNMFREVDGVYRYFGFALMSNRKKELYEEVFKYLRDELLMEPKRMISDYELPMRAAAKSVWKGIELPGCVFHFRQAIRRKFLQKIKVKPRGIRQYIQYKRLRLMLYNLQLLPADKIRRGTRRIRDKQIEYGLVNIFTEMNNYFQRFWMNKIKPNGFSMFRLDQRTNNFNESINAQMSRGLSRHPTVFEFLSYMKKLMINEYHRITVNEEYIQRSYMTAKLRIGWTGIENGTLSITDFLMTNFSER